MKIKVGDIPEKGYPLEAVAPRDGWFLELMGVFGEDYSPGAPARLSLQLLRTCDNVLVSGQVETDLQPVCDRCLEVFAKHVVIPIRLHLSPRIVTEDRFDDTEFAEDDEDFAFYQDHEIDLGRLLEETIALEIPLRNLCQEGCRGLCPRCGKNLNHAQCAC